MKNMCDHVSSPQISVQYLINKNMMVKESPPLRFMCDWVSDTQLQIPSDEKKLHYCDII